MESGTTNKRSGLRLIRCRFCLGAGYSLSQLELCDWERVHGRLTALTRVTRRGAALAYYVETKMGVLFL